MVCWSIDCLFEIIFKFIFAALCKLTNLTTMLIASNSCFISAYVSHLAKDIIIFFIAHLKCPQYVKIIPLDLTIPNTPWLFVTKHSSLPITWKNVILLVVLFFPKLTFLCLTFLITINIINWLTDWLTQHRNWQKWISSPCWFTSQRFVTSKFEEVRNEKQRTAFCSTAYVQRLKYLGNSPLPSQVL